MSLDEDHQSLKRKYTELVELAGDLYQEVHALKKQRSLWQNEKDFLIEKLLTLETQASLHTGKSKHSRPRNRTSIPGILTAGLTDINKAVVNVAPPGPNGDQYCIYVVNGRPCRLKLKNLDYCSHHAALDPRSGYIWCQHFDERGKRCQIAVIDNDFPYCIYHGKLYDPTGTRMNRVQAQVRRPNIILTNISEKEAKSLDETNFNTKLRRDFTIMYLLDIEASSSSATRVSDTSRASHVNIDRDDADEENDEDEAMEEEDEVDGEDDHDEEAEYDDEDDGQVEHVEDDGDDPLTSRKSVGPSVSSVPGLGSVGGKNVRMSHGAERLAQDQDDDDGGIMTRLNVPLITPLHNDSQHSDSILGLDERTGHIDLMDASVMDLDLPSNVHGESIWDQSVWQHDEFH